MDESMLATPAKVLDRTSGGGVLALGPPAPGISDAGLLFASAPVDYALMGTGRKARPRAVERISEIAIAALYRKYSPAIYAHCRRLLQSQAAARDATQEAFVRVLTRGPLFPNEDDALRYLYRVSTNVCLNQIRETKVHTRAAASLRSRPSWSGSMEGRHVDREFVAAVLDRCGEAGAAVAIMHYVDGMSQVEIAGILGITRRTVFNRLRKLARIAHDLLGAPPMNVMDKEEGHS
jgi:RNA polymerase sigma-70 factor, ECF subfamily